MSLINNILHYWKFDESSGNATDSVASATLTNSSTSYVPGKILNGASFLGNSSSKLQGTATDPDGYASGFSWAGWVYWNSATSGTQRWFIQIPESAGWGTCYIGNRGGVGGENGLTFVYKFGNGASGFYGFNTGTTIPVATWTHVAATVAGTTNKFYVNGTLVSTNTASANIQNNSSTVVFGNESGNAYGWNGLVDEWGIWGKELTAGEVSQLYNGGAGLSYPFITNSGNFFAVM